MKEYSHKRGVVVYDSLLCALKPVNKFCGKRFDLSKLSYKTVRSIEKSLRKGKTFDDISRAFQLAFSISDKEFYDAKILDFYGARNFLISELERLMTQEKNLLKSDGVDVNAWEEAGGKSLEPLSEILPLIKLGKIYGIYPFDLNDKPYNEIMLLLVTHKRSDAVEVKYNQITSKNKTR